MHVVADHRQAVAVGLEREPNRLAGDFSPSAPDLAWSSDITCIATDDGWLYLAAVIGPFSRQVVGWTHMQASLVTDALRMAWFRRHPLPGLVFHSDRGSPYCNGTFQAALATERAARSRWARFFTHLDVPERR